MFFGITALFLACVGLYGVMSFMVGQRTREWGVRMALGANRNRVTRLVLMQGVKQLAVGLALGLALAGAISVPLSTIFYQVEPWDRWVFALVAVILTSTGMLATVIPARRATRVDPLRALRYE
jgi:ABC-type antimicrobial peptide transport system permease subunit